MPDRAIFKAGEGPVHQIRPDFAGTVIAGENVTLVRWEIPPDRPPIRIHAHGDMEQVTIVIAGSVETTVGDEVVILRPGDVCRIARNVPHGATRALGGTPAVTIDVFAPPRADYVAATRQEPLA
jgi:quercetin dioxygenase-like cupin family protein